MSVQISNPGNTRANADASDQPRKNLACRLRDANEFLLPFEVAEFDYRAAIQYGTVRASLAREGTPIGSLDALIGHIQPRSRRSLSLTTRLSSGASWGCVSRIGPRPKLYGAHLIQSIYRSYALEFSNQVLSMAYEF
jgi:hypothetical protein